VNYGNVTMRNLSITGGNSSSYPAGAIRSYSGGDLTLEHVLIYGNKGGGPSSAIEGNGQVLLENSTVSGNVTTETNPTIATAAVYAYGNMILNNSTVTNNVGGGLRGTGPNSITLRNSIISNNGSGINCSALVTMIYTGRNISDDDSCGGPADMLIGNPLLAPLADNGGPTRTHALQTGSLAINAGTSCTVAVDQRYVARDTACDLGAFEFIDFTTVELAPSASVSVSKSDRWAVVTGTVRCSRGETFEVAVDLEQSQRAGTVKASGTTAVTCSTASQPWSVALAPASGSFEVGSGKASVRTANTAAWVTPASTANTVKFFWARK
jgi:hypothetical protein